MLIVMLGINRLVAQDLAPGINYSYNPPGSNGVITDITIDIVNNDNTAASSFSVAIYLYQPSNGDYWVIDQTSMSSLSGNSVVTISNWDIDINNTAGIPAGSGYRIGIWADNNDDISESDESNNTGLLSGSFSYTPSSGSSVGELSMAELQPVSPNPSSGMAKFSFSLKENAEVKLDIYNASGQLVKNVVNEKLSEGDHSYALDCGVLDAGIYYYTLSTGTGSLTGKLVVVN